MLTEQYDYEGKCWWSGLVADTKEHRLKASILKNLFPKPDSDPVLIRGKKIIPVGSHKSEKAKFRKKSLNSRYNNELSKDFDNAFSRFSDFIYSKIDQIIETNQLNLMDIWGWNYLADHLNYLRFIAKHVGCRLYDFGLKVPNTLIDFLNKGMKCECLVVQYYVDSSLLELTENGKYPYFGVEPLDLLMTKDYVITDLTGGIELGPFIIRYILSSEINEKKYPGVEQAFIYPTIRVDLIQRIDENGPNFHSTSNHIDYMHSILPKFTWFNQNKYMEY